MYTISTGNVELDNKSPLFLGHGGGCCGRKCFSNFNYEGVNKKQLNVFKQKLEKVKEMYSSNNKNKGQLVEIVLEVEAQIEWEKIILEEGFEPILDWRNNNTGHMLRMYTLFTGDSDGSGYARV